nr:MAG TPA: hypothetical protein [Caudoviricetes sp.]
MTGPPSRRNLRRDFLYSFFNQMKTFLLTYLFD